jgi:formate dehydrogenase subunit gamma
MSVTTTGGRGDVGVVEEERAEVTEPEPATIARYNLFERVLHWVVAITFVALILSGLALAYPRLAWLSGLFGGGQTMRAAHPWIGVVFTVGLVAMLVIWARGMWLDATDRAWFRRVRAYARAGHVRLDTGRWNGGQKGYFWASLVFGIVLLVTGIPLWFPSIGGAGVHEWSRLIHHVAYLVMLAGLIIHVLLSVFLFPGTLEGMTSGRVTRAWAAWHHPRWFRETTQPTPTRRAEAEPEPAGKAEAEGRET